MGSSDCKNSVRFAETLVGLLESPEKAGNGGRTDGDVLANAYITLPQFSGNELQPCAGFRFIHPEQIFRQQLGEVAVNFTNAIHSDGVSLQAALIYPALDADMRSRFKLEVAFADVAAVVVIQRTLTVDWVSIVAFYQVAVVAIHGTDQIGQG